MVQTVAFGNFMSASALIQQLGKRRGVAISLGYLLLFNSLLVIASLRINIYSTRNLHSSGNIFCSNLIYQMTFLEFNFVINYQ